MRRLVLSCALVLALATPAWAQFTPAQMAAIRDAIAADPALTAIPNTYPAGATALSAALNADYAPAFTVWRTAVTIGEVGKAFDGGDLAGLTATNHTRLQTLAIYLAGGVNPSLANNRQFFDDIFSGAGGAATRANLLALWKRKARYIEKIFAAGAGTDVSPALLVYQGTIGPADAFNARNLP